MNEPKIYDSRPSTEAMIKRCKKDRIDFSEMKEIVAPVRHYAIRAYGLPTKAAEFDGINTVEVDAFIVYSLDRSGRIGNGWGIPHKASSMIFVGEHQ